MLVNYFCDLQERIYSELNLTTRSFKFVNRLLREELLEENKREVYFLYL